MRLSFLICLLLAVQISFSFKETKRNKDFESDLVESLFKNLSKLEKFRPEAAKILRLVKKRTSNKKGYGFPLISGGNKKSFKIHKRATLQLEVQKELKNKFGVRKLSARIPHQFCPRVNIKCEPSKFRSVDGSCNNIENGWFGMANSPYKRMLPPAYEDEIDWPRSFSKADNRQLPNPRSIALVVHASNITKSTLSNLFLFFGQTIDHDVASTGGAVESDGSPKLCTCDSEDPECFNIPIPEDDPFNLDQECFDFPRSGASTINFECEMGHREQLNMVTHYADLSFLYGSDSVTLSEIRAFNNGLMLADSIPGINRDFLPFVSSPFCNGVDPFDRCFKSGESRTEHNIYLTGIQLVFLREHNRIANRLSALNPTCSDERLFQETRKILIAIYQHIIYKQWLPILVGPALYTEFGLSPLEKGYFMNYDSSISAILYNELPTAALRFGHSMIKHEMHKAHSNFTLFEPFKTNHMQFSSQRFFKNGIRTPEDYLRGLIAEGCFAWTSQVNPVLNNLLFEDLLGGFKRFSLPALNIQRGRDHGIPSYIKYRELCGLKKANTIDELDNIPIEIRQRLKSIYKDVSDIDLWTGGVSEIPVENGAIGKTFACMLAMQFSDLKIGDRYYYEHGHDPMTRFSEQQLKEIRKASIEKLMCNNVAISSLQTNAFMVSNRVNNSFVRCRDIPDLDLGAWKLDC